MKLPFCSRSFLTSPKRAATSALSWVVALTKIGFISFKRKPGVPGLFLVLHDVLVFSRLEAFVDGDALDDELHDLLNLAAFFVIGWADVIDAAVII